MMFLEPMLLMQFRKQQLRYVYYLRVTVAYRIHSTPTVAVHVLHSE